MVEGHEHDDDRFAQQIRPYVFGGHKPSTSPKLVLLGAQPGAGKSRAVARILHADPDTDFVYVTGDALRPFHPRYATLIRTDPIAMPNATGPAVARWVRACIDHALTHRYSLVLEGTFRDTDVVAATLRRFAAAGYHTQAVVLAVRSERSRLDCLLRWLGTDPAEPARWTPPSAHDTSFTRLPNTVAALNDVTELHRITVHTRAQVIFTDERQADGHWDRPNQAAVVLRAEHQQPPDPEAATAWLDHYQWAIETSEQLPTLDARAVPLYLAAFEDADRIAAVVAPQPADPRHRPHADIQRRAAAILHRGHPSLAPITGPSPLAGQAFRPPAGFLPEARPERLPAPPPVHDTTASRRRARKPG